VKQRRKGEIHPSRLGKRFVVDLHDLEAFLERLKAQQTWLALSNV